MPLEFAMLVEDLDDDEAINLALQGQWEPFAVYKDRVYFRRMFHNEDREPQSSTKPENKNWMGNEPDEGEDEEETDDD